MFDRLDDLEREYDDVLARLATPDVAADRNRLVELSRRAKELEAVVAAYRAYRSAGEDLEAAREMQAEATGEDRDFLRAQMATATAELDRLDAQLKLLLLPKDPNDERNVIVEIRGAEGGEEANLFARDLFDMYTRFAERQGWKTQVLGSDVSDRGGFNEVTLLVSGRGAWSRLKHEAGPHRVQRVPVTESQGRIHTSAATVSVLPEADEVDVEINDADLKIDVYRSQGPGGQSVNTTDSAVRVTHLPTGMVVSMQDEKSQLQNRAKALQVLRARLLAAEQDRQAAETSQERRSQIGAGGRSEKVRTYNFKENRVTDHRIGLTVYNLDKVLLGELDDLVDGLCADERTRQLAGG